MKEIKHIYPLDTQAPLKRFGSLERFQSAAGDTITILPSCEVPVSVFSRDRWAITSQMGNARSVRSIDSLDDGTKPGLVVKSPERVFTTETRVLNRGEIWWGGRKSGERPIRIDGHPVVEQQAIWEAAILLELLQKGVRVEKPQALIEQPNGQIELVVKEIPSSYWGAETSGPDLNEIIDKVKATTTLTPVDASHYNAMRDVDGELSLIDVNRWKWAPYTEDHRDMIAHVIRESIAEQSRVA